MLKQGLTQSPEPHLDTLEQHLLRIKTDTDKINYLWNMVYVYQNLDMKKSIAYARVGFDLAKRNQNWTKAGDFLGYIGEDFTLAGQFDSAQTPLQQQYDLGKQHNNYRAMALSVYNRASIAQQQGNYVLAQQYSFESYKIAEEHSDTGIMVAACTNISSIYAMQRNFDKARDYAQNSIYLQKNRHSGKRYPNDLSAICEELLGVCYREQKVHDSALKYFDMAWQYYRSKDNESGMAMIYTQQSAVYDGTDPRALDYALKAQAIWDKVSPESLYSINNLATIGMIYFALARSETPGLWKGLAASKTQLVRMATDALQRSVALSRKLKMQAIVMENADSLAKMEAYQGNYKEAYELSQEHTRLADTIYSQDTKNKIAEIEKQHDIDLRDKQLQIDHLEISNQKKIRWLLISGLSLLFIAMLVITWQSRQRKKINQQLSQLNRELDAAGKIKTKFFAILNHDLRRPMGNFINLLHLVQHRPGLLKEGGAEENARKISMAAEGLLETMDDLLLWTKGQMENFKPEIRRVPVARLFEDLQKNFPAIEPVALTFEQEPGMTILTDENYCQTILRNLTNNALLALGQTPNGIIAWKAWKDADKTYLRITDNGPGATPEQLQALFDGASPVGVRNGLGLHVVRDMAKAVGGKVSAKAAPDGGLEILLELKATIAEHIPV